MSMKNTFDVCAKDLFTDEQELSKLYNERLVKRVLRIREIYAFFIGQPSSGDFKLVDESVRRFGISRRQAFSDLAIIKQLLPMFTAVARDFHRWRANEMLLETYELAKRRKDTKTMASAAASYAKYNKVDIEDENSLPFDKIVVQPFTPTVNPEVLGLKPIPNVREKIKNLIERYSRESPEILDVEAEDADIGE